MTGLPIRTRKNHDGKDGKRFHPDQELTESEAVAYAAMRGFYLPVHRLQQSRTENPRCTGPKYLRIDGYHVRYTPRLLDEYIEARKPRLIDPAQRMEKAS